VIFGVDSANGLRNTGGSDLHGPRDALGALGLVAAAYVNDHVGVEARDEVVESVLGLLHGDPAKKFPRSLLQLERIREAYGGDVLLVEVGDELSKLVPQQAPKAVGQGEAPEEREPVSGIAHDELQGCGEAIICNPLVHPQHRTISDDEFAEGRGQVVDHGELVLGSVYGVQRVLGGIERHVAAEVQDLEVVHGLDDVEDFALHRAHVGIVRDEVGLRDDQRFDGGALCKGGQELADVCVVLLAREIVGPLQAQGHADFEAANVWRMSLQHLCQDQQLYDILQGRQEGTRIRTGKQLHDVDASEWVERGIEIFRPLDVAHLEGDTAIHGGVVPHRVHVGAHVHDDVHLLLVGELQERPVQGEVVQREAVLEEVDDIAFGKHLLDRREEVALHASGVAHAAQIRSNFLFSSVQLENIPESRRETQMGKGK